MDERSTIKRVFDGDTVELADGRHVRFVGINAPEVAHKESPAEPLADQAKQVVEKMFANDHTVLLRYDAERFDVHHRTLAHLFLSDRSSVEAKLLEEGLAFAIAIPPDIWNTECYERAEEAARKAQRGIWANKYYEPIPAARVTLKNAGFHAVLGTVQRIGRSKNSIWLNMTNSFALRVDREDLAYFGASPEKLRGHTLIARGWITQARNGGTMMRVRHPSALEVQ